MPSSYYRDAKMVSQLQVVREDDQTVALTADVVVFGAGIAGLTAAHELAERNFRVAIVDPDIREDPLYSTSADDDNPGLGGMARTQWRYLYNVAARRHITQLPDAPSTTLPTKGRPFRPFVVDWHLTRDDAIRAADFDSRLPVGFHERCDQVRKMLRDHPIRPDEMTTGTTERPFEVTLAVTPRPLDDDEFEVVRAAFTAAVAAANLTEQQAARALALFDFPNFAAYIAVWESRWIDILEVLDGVPEETIDAIDRAYDYESVIGTAMARKISGNDDLAQRLFHVMVHDYGSEPGKAFVEPNTFVLPGEHGFRFFPSFYRHLFDIMRRTPRMKPRQRTGREFVRAERGTVFDNLVPAERLVLSSTSPEPSIKLLRRDGFTLERLRQLIHGLLHEAGYSEADLVRLTTSFLKYLTSSRQRREKEYEGKSWYEFVEADRMSRHGRRLTEMIPGTLVGLLGSESDARTQGTVALQCMLDQFGDGSRSDMLLDGPTDNAWLGHWHRYLSSQQVSFHRGKLTGFRLAPDGRVVPEVDLSEGPVTFKPANPNRPVYYVIALPLASREGVPGALELAEDFVASCQQGNVECFRDFADLCSFAGSSSVIQAGLSQPVPAGPLRHLSGIQYFFAQDLRLWRSHTQYLDAPAGLTAIAQPQFWTDPRNLLTGYRSVLSVDIGTFSPPRHEGHPIPGTSGDPADYPWGKTHRQIADLVWRQLVAAHAGDFPADKPEQMPRPAAFHVDENLVMRPPTRGAEPVVSGNNSPYLVNVKGQFRRRPGLAAPASCSNGWKAQIAYQVAADQYVLAGTHMQTYTRITSMESACESARHAVNALLAAMELPGEHCAIFDPEDHEPDLFDLAKELDDRLCTQNARHTLG